VAVFPCRQWKVAWAFKGAEFFQALRLLRMGPGSSYQKSGQGGWRDLDGLARLPSFLIRFEAKCIKLALEYVTIHTNYMFWPEAIS
jgi:hypothetical protein